MGANLRCLGTAESGEAPARGRKQAQGRCLHCGQVVSRDVLGGVGAGRAYLVVGTKQPNVARLESGRVVPRIDLLFRVARALGTPLGKLVAP